MRVGEIMRIVTPTRRIEVEVLDVPQRPPSRKDRTRFYRVLSEETLNPYDDLSF